MLICDGRKESGVSPAHMSFQIKSGMTYMLVKRMSSGVYHRLSWHWHSSVPGQPWVGAGRC